jgi:hypothetical protein
MSSLFSQISQAAAQQRRQVEQLPTPEAPTNQPATTSATPETPPKPANTLVSQETRKQASPPIQEPVPWSPPSPERSILEREKQGNKEAGWLPSQPATPSPVYRDGKSGKPSLVPFTPEPIPGRQLTKKQTFELHKAHVDFMDQAKFELRALGVSKEEMVRTGLELLAKDYSANQKNSYLYRKFASREVEEEPQR